MSSLGSAGIPRDSRTAAELRPDRQTVPERILRFWRDVETFTLPAALDARKQTKSVRLWHLTEGEPLPWLPHGSLLTPRPGHVWVHTVFIGVVDASVLMRTVLSAAIPRAAAMREEELEATNGKSWLAAFSVDEHGCPISESYVRASFGLGVGRLREGKSLDGIDESLADAKEEFKLRWSGRGTAGFQAVGLGWHDLAKELEIAAAPLGGVPTTVEFAVLVKSVERKQGTERREATDSDVDFLNSFFLDDLDRLIDQVGRGRALGPALSAYLADETRAPKRADVLADAGAMARLVSAGRLPPGRWPSSSKHHLYLGQQAAVMETLGRLKRGSGLVAINGPPGTGKSTLLNEIVANIVVERAQELAKLDHPREVFEKEPAMIGGSKTFPLRKDIVSGTGIVVTSSNNAAVENITRELPARSRIDAVEHSEAGYFTQVAASVFSQIRSDVAPWGLVAAALGNALNRKNFAHAFFRDDPAREREHPRQDHADLPLTIKQLLESAVGQKERWDREWRSARTEFQDLLRRFEDIKAQLLEAEQAIAKTTALSREIGACRAEIEQLGQERADVMAATSARLESAGQDLDRWRLAGEASEQSETEAQLQLEAVTERLRAASDDSPPSLWDRTLRVLAIQTGRYRSWLKQVTPLRRARAHAIDQLTKAAAEHRAAQKTIAEKAAAIEHIKDESAARLAAIMHAHARLELNLQRLERDLEEAEGTLDGTRALGITLPDAAFWNSPAEERQLASLWLSPSIDHIRSRIFLTALRLHETTIRACASRFIANFRAVRGMLARSTKEPIKPEHRPLVWDMLFFCVPVISTTLASFSRLFQHMGQDSIGWLLVDEAGQATPQSLAGALWRSRRAIVVGDPLQIEPVSTVPGGLVTRLRESRWVSEAWSPAVQSAQTVADRAMDVGTWVGPATADDRVWTGLPLRAHRRCDSPMFDVANCIAYAGQMVQANSRFPVVDTPLNESAWFDVRGHNADAQVVGDEIAALDNLLGQIGATWPNVVVEGRPASPARVYVISPFKTVAECCKEVARRHAPRAGGHLSCGTVHTFQGKEADIVFIVLGSAPGRQGDGSRGWASQRPNLLNVAITRARLRVFVVGNRADWSACSYFCDLAAALPVRDFQQLAAAE